MHRTRVRTRWRRHMTWSLAFRYLINLEQTFAWLGWCSSVASEFCSWFMIHDFRIVGWEEINWKLRMYQSCRHWEDKWVYLNQVIKFVHWLNYFLEFAEWRVPFQVRVACTISCYPQIIRGYRVANMPHTLLGNMHLAPFPRCLCRIAGFGECAMLSSFLPCVKVQESAPLHDPLCWIPREGHVHGV